MKRFLYVSIFFLVYISCNENKTGTTKEPIEAVKDDTAETFKMLQGTWVNVQDTLSTISFEGSTSTNSYNGTPNGRTIHFTIGNNCAAGQTVTISEKDKYINTTGAAEECYYIKTLTKSTLELQLVASDLTLAFKRQ